MKILLFKAHGSDPLSQAIKNITQSPYCHAAVLIDQQEPYRVIFSALCGLNDNGENMICEEFYPCARARMLAPGEIDQCDQFTIVGWTDENEAAAMRWWVDAIKEKIRYDGIDLPRFLPLVRLILGHPDITEEGAKRHMFCSDAVVQCCKNSGRPILNAPGCMVDPGKITWSTLVKQI